MNGRMNRAYAPTVPESSPVPRVRDGAKALAHRWGVEQHVPDDLSRPIGGGSPQEGDVAPLGEATQTIPFREAAASLGDPGAADAVWREHRRWVAGVLLAYKPRWADLEDLLQDVAATLVRKGHEVRDRGAIRPWLRTVAINAAHALARSAKSRPRSAVGGEGDLGQESTPGLSGDHREAPEALSDRERARRLMELAAKLPDGYREPLLLKAIQGLSYREIGRIVGLPETTVETRIARGRRMLRELAEQAENSGSRPDRAEGE